MNNRIKRIRLESDLTQQAFADRLGIAPSTVGNYEQGTRIPNNATIQLICREFNINEQWLRTGEGEMLVNIDRTLNIAHLMGRLTRDLSLEPDSFRAKCIEIILTELLDMPTEKWDKIRSYAKQLLVEESKNKEQ